MIKITPLLALLLIAKANAAEQQFHGLADMRYSVSDSVESYVSGGYGKFRYDDGDQWSLAEVALSYKVQWDNNLSVHIIANGYADGVNDGVGLTEVFFQYKSLPSENGLRFQLKAGMLYPKVSMENIITGWASPYTLSYSTINSWIAEEVRHNGIEASFTRLGKFSNREHDISVSVALIDGNDPTGAMLAWHGWVLSSRQTLRQDTLPLPSSEARFVPEESDPYLELDNRIGYHFNVNWSWHGHGKLLVGYYDNNADPKVVENRQWAWTTRFAHIGINWQLAHDVEFTAQYLRGDTLMQSSRTGSDLVNNDYHSAFIMLSKKWQQHRVTVRVEEFAVLDKDTRTDDDNEEYGKAGTLNYSYRIGRHWLIQTEYNWIRSDRPSRHPQKLTERQGQLSVRYFF